MSHSHAFASPAPTTTSAPLNDLTPVSSYQRLPDGYTSPQPHASPQPDDHRRHAQIGDTIAVGVAVVAAQLVNLVTAPGSATGGASAVLLPLAVFAGWLTWLAVAETRDRHLLGAGRAQYSRVTGVSWKLAAVLGFLGYLLGRSDIGYYVLVAVPLGTALLLAERWALRSRRAQLVGTSRVVVVGSRAAAGRTIANLNSGEVRDYQVVGACVTDARPGQATIDGVPVLGGPFDAATAAAHVRADAVALADGAGSHPDYLQTLGWDLEPAGIDLLLAPALPRGTAHRLSVRETAGLPLVSVTSSQFTGAKYAVKSVVDWVIACAITLALLPALATLAVLVKVTSPGPVLYKQERIGRNGEPFPMLKFRSMVPDAHSRLSEVLGGEKVSMFYKVKDDPRVTPLGRIMRRYSLDELPQLFNVLRGEMSLVGPRPQIKEEVEQYDRAASRRLLVKPGLTGLWQVSGRSSLSPDEGIRMDVQYADNWTLTGDLVILSKTAQAVFRGEGAY